MKRRADYAYRWIFFLNFHMPSQRPARGRQPRQEEQRRPGARPQGGLPRYPPRPRRGGPQAVGVFRCTRRLKPFWDMYLTGKNAAGKEHRKTTGRETKTKPAASAAMLLPPPVQRAALGATGRRQTNGVPGMRCRLSPTADVPSHTSGAASAISCREQMQQVAPLTRSTRRRTAGGIRARQGLSKAAICVRTEKWPTGQCCARARRSPPPRKGRKGPSMSAAR